MLVFIDESGCPGFKMARGSDPIFAVGMVIFRSSEDATVAQALIQRLHSSLGHKPEFKFSKCDARVRDGFFEAVAGQCAFTVRALVVEKKLIYSKELRRNNDSYYNYFVKQLMSFDGGILRNARVRIDGSGDRDFQRALGSYLRRELRGKIRDVKMVDSSRDSLMQLADMSIGAIARSYRERPDAARWRSMLRTRIKNVWTFR